jgi:hypothetical protein
MPTNNFIFELPTQTPVLLTQPPPTYTPITSNQLTTPVTP